MAEGGIGLRPTKKILKVDMGRKMMEDLNRSLNREGAKRPLVEAALDQFANTVEAVLQFQRDHESTPYEYDVSRVASMRESLKHFKSLTTEERALAAGYAVALITDSNPLLKTYRLNIENVTQEKFKQGVASLSSIGRTLIDKSEEGQVRTGTTESRMDIIEPAVRATLYGIVDPVNLFGQKMISWDHDLRRDLYDKAPVDLKTHVGSAGLFLKEVVGKSVKIK